MKTSKGKSLSEPVYEHLRDMILSLEIRAGEKIPEEKISKKFGISRTPIREALRRLSNEGIVDIYPNRFASVVVFDDEYIRNMGIIRLSLDITAIKLAIYYGGNADFERLMNIADQCQEASRKGDFFLQNKLDVAFHMEIGKISRNPLIQKYQSHIFLQLELLLNTRHSSTDAAYVHAHAFHHEIAEALMARDSKTATKLATDHLSEFYQLEQYLPVLFADA